VQARHMQGAEGLKVRGGVQGRMGLQPKGRALPMTLHMALQGTAGFGPHGAAAKGAHPADDPARRGLALGCARGRGRRVLGRRGLDLGDRHDRLRAQRRGGAQADGACGRVGSQSKRMA